MGAPQARAGPDLVSDRVRPDRSAAAVLDFAVAQILRDDTALSALSAVLARLVTMPGVRAAVAFQPAAGPRAAAVPPRVAGQPAPPRAAAAPPRAAGQAAAGPQARVLAMHPPGAVEPGVLARIGALTLAQRDAVPTAPVQVTVAPGEPATSALLAYSAPVDGVCLCALALVGDATDWDEEIRATVHGVATVVATQFRHDGNLTRLAERQTLTRELIAASPTAILATDAGGRLLEFNPAAEKLSGYRRDDVLDRPTADFLVPERDRARFREYLRTGPSAGDAGELTGPMRICILTADGTERTVELTPVQITIGGEVVFTGFMRDLTEIERSHAALADQTERLDQLIAAATPGILISNDRGRITHINQSFSAMFGLGEAGPLVGTPAALIVGRIGPQFEQAAEFVRRSAEVLSSRQQVSGARFKMADGRTIAHGYWPVLVDGRFRGDLWLAWDVSERTALEEQRAQMLQAERRHAALAEQARSQLAEQNERLRKLDEARNQFLAIVSHELRTPLTSIVSFSELIRGEAEGLTPDGVQFLAIIERNADRLHRLVGDLLMLDRLDAGALPLDLGLVRVADLVTEAVRSASAGAAKQGVTVEVRAGDGPDLSADHRRLMQVLDNLIANAVKFSHRNSRVRVTADYRGGYWRIDVADDGIGIPPDEAGQLFHRFVRASNARTAGLPGTGLGLSIVKVLVEMHGGHVEADSTLGHGSTFRVYLPGPESDR
jgi:PAS domain S-box-containing protein